MSGRFITIAFAAAALLGGAPASAAKFNLDFTASANQARRMVDGIAAIESAAPGSKIRIIAPGEPVKKRGVLQIMVFNGSAAPFDIGSESITAQLSDGTPVPIISAQELQHEAKHRAMWRGIAAGFAAAGNGMSAANSGWSNSTVNYTGHSYGSYGSSYSSGTALVTTYNPAQAQAAQSLANIQNQQTFDRMNFANQSEREALRASLQTTTVDPGGMAGGLVTFELPAAARSTKGPVLVSFLIHAGQEQHVVIATLTAR